MLKTRAWIADVNPFYHMVEIVRAPLLGKEPATLSWEVTSVMGAAMLISACALFVRYRHRIIFWL